MGLQAPLAALLVSTEIWDATQRLLISAFKRRTLKLCNERNHQTLGNMVILFLAHLWVESSSAENKLMTYCQAWEGLLDLALDGKT